MATIVTQVFLNVMLHIQCRLVGCYEYPTEHEIEQTSKFSLYDQIVTS